MCPCWLISTHEHQNSWPFFWVAVYILILWESTVFGLMKTSMNPKQVVLVFPKAFHTPLTSTWRELLHVDVLLKKKAVFLKKERKLCTKSLVGSNNPARKQTGSQWCKHHWLPDIQCSWERRALKVRKQIQPCRLYHIWPRSPKCC